MDMSQHASLAEKTFTEAKTSNRTETRQAAVIFAIVALALAGWAASGFFFGIPGVALPALALVPGIFVTLVLIARG